MTQFRREQTSLGQRKDTNKTGAKDLVPVLNAVIQTKRGDSKGTRIRILVDSGASGSLINKKFVTRLKTRKDDTTSWSTTAGQFKTRERAKIYMEFPQLSPTLSVTEDIHVADTLSPNYDMIMGRPLIRLLRLQVNFAADRIERDELCIPMEPAVKSNELHFTTGIEEPEATKEALRRVKDILRAKYAPVSVKQILESSPHLTRAQKDSLEPILNKHASLFDGTLGKWKGILHDVELKDPTLPPIACRPYSVPVRSKKTLMIEIKRLCDLGVLKKINNSEWQAPSSIIPKKDGTVRFITDFRKLNTRIKRKPFPLPSIKDLLLELKGFKYGTSLDLNMGYYHIELTPRAKRLCTIVFPFGKYEYQRLPMGLCNSPDIFQEHMSNLMRDLDYVSAYLDDVAILSSNDWNDHLHKVDQVLERLQKAGLKVNALKSFFGRTELEYLGYVLTQEGVQPLQKKVDGMLQIAPPKNIKQLRRFLGMVNYYRDMWLRRSHILTPLNALLSKNTKWRWTDIEQRAFENIKRVMSRETLLHYPDFNKTFEIHTDASLHQLGAVISQNNKPIAFYTRKLRGGQHNYTTTERELLAIIETLKEFRNILLGHKIKIYTDHKNLTFTQFNTERVMRWRLILEEYNPELIYIKGPNNVVADALSRLDLLPELPENAISAKSRFTKVSLQEFCAFQEDELAENAYPLRFSLISREQQKDSALLKRLNDPGFTLKQVRGGNHTHDLIYYRDRIVVPRTLQKRIMEWYHIMLMHPGVTRTEQTIQQNFTWPNLHKDVERLVKTCPICQVNKKNKPKYGHLPAKSADVDPWKVLCIDLIGPYKIAHKRKEDLKLQCLTMIDPATGWFEIVQLPKDNKGEPIKRADVIANLLEQTWFTRYPWPEKVICDRGSEFMAEVKTMLKEEYGCKVAQITTRNPQGNSMLERIHQTIGNMIRTARITDEEDPFSGILSAVAFATRATIHTTNGATPSQLVFGRDAILNTRFEANWALIRERKQKQINRDNKRENSKRKEHHYRVGDKIIVKNDPSRKYGEDQYIGPYTITHVYDNGTVRYHTGRLQDTINIRNISPYHE